ncbi:putative cytosolic 5prime-nucleotidase 3 [Diplonema papillatum]|nr:putative cytosolic 5prime-nucleotidase 3 [Diplonema papillatum]|eukprot:gene2021-3095_t
MAGVRMKDPAAVALKREKIIAGGTGNLKVISDFDFTLSRFWFAEGERACSCYKAIEDCGLLSADYHDRAKALQQKYYPIEVDPRVPWEEKLSAMYDWVCAANRLLEESGLHQDMIRPLVADAKLHLRGKAVDCIEALQKQRVPLLVFSGGIANILEEVLVREGVELTADTHVVSNKMVFDGKGHIASWTDPKFHAFNKKARTIAHERFVKDEMRRKNVLLFGDSLGDVHMSDGLEIDTLLSVAFLNDKVEERLDEYMNAFDVVILGDGDMSFHFDLINAIS